ncbi:methyl-accepting chemotaxis protein [Paenibacillus roseipurpureus]|uniref:Methyl-accepting chemotaxis protein n=1 Tax=Paenibacillus roseopurpureus TaxID=2918901 RepID=A0AA96LPK9_9BACL|nr:methyl-accepting chemotaxis protein [Paenibacillus sp. MBLB1832]WNR44879.1 methyl-accepting chemotaxis protein [Paenibacillus sp. MBLB1832]
MQGIEKWLGWSKRIGIKMKLRQKLIGSFAVVLLFMGILGLSDMVRMKHMKQDMASIAQDWMMGSQLIQEFSYLTEHFAKDLLVLRSAPDNATKLDIEATLVKGDRALQSYQDALSGQEDEKNFLMIMERWGKLKTDYASFSKATDSQEKDKLYDELIQSYNSVQNICRLMVTFNQQGANDSVAANAEQYRSSIVSAIILLAVAVIVSMAISWVMIMNITKPVIAASHVLDRMAEGDLTVEELRFKNKDEIGVLVGAVNGMTRQIRGVMSRMQESSSAVAASSEQLYASSEQNSGASQHVAVDIQTIAAEAETQRLNALECARAMDEIAIGVQRIAETTSDVSDLSIHATEQARNGQEDIHLVTTSMHALSSTVTQANQTIHQLAEHSQHIGKVSTMIGEIATQTNLLALNAAIEAARAGESGKGFAVVAEEVRKLATQTGESVGAIRTVVTNIQKDTQEAVKAMDAGLAEVHKGLQSVDRTELSFQAIVRSAEEVAAKIQETAAAAQQMAASSQQVAATVTNMEQVARITSELSQNVAGATEEQLASAQEVTSSSQMLASIAQDLQDMINTYKMN